MGMSDNGQSDTLTLRQTNPGEALITTGCGNNNHRYLITQIYIKGETHERHFYERP